MAKVLKEYDRSESDVKQGRPPIYPWDEWLDGRIWELTQGEDFEISMDNMENYIRKTAYRKEIEISVFRHDEKTLIIHPYQSRES